jgi:hypothetical protein
VSLKEEKRKEERDVFMYAMVLEVVLLVDVGMPWYLNLFLKKKIKRYVLSL